MRELPDLMQTLPPELRQEIYAFTFQPDGSVRLIDGAYRPPAQLHVDRTSRQKFAELYYGQGAIFQTNRSVGRKWLTSLPQTQRSRVRKIRVENDFLPDLKLQKDSCADSEGAQALIQFMQQRSSAVSCLGAASAKLYIRVLWGPEREERWVSCENEFIALFAELG